METKYRVTMEGYFRDFDLLIDAADYLVRNWNEETTYVKIQKIKFKQ